MTRHEVGDRFRSATSSSADSAHSGVTVTPVSSSSPSAAAARREADERGHRRMSTIPRLSSKQSGPAPSSTMTPTSSSTPTSNSTPTASTAPNATPAGSPAAARSAPMAISTPSSSNAPNASRRNSRRISDLRDYRRDLAVLDSSGNRLPQIQHSPPSGHPSSMTQGAPWMTSGDDDGVSPLAGVSSGGGGGGPLTPQDGPIPTSFYNDSSDNLSSALASPLSPVFRQPAPMRPVPSFPPHDAQHDMAPFDNDDRRPSLASIATSSSTGSRNSGVRRGGLQKLQGFFGEQFPGRDGSETSLQSHSRPTRERNYSNATDHTRDASPASSRPRTPVPAPEVVPFLYQNSDDIARYGEAPVREILSGPDRERYINSEDPNSAQGPPKTSSSNRSGHSTTKTASHHHRHNRSIDDGRALRPMASREDSQASLHVQNVRERGASAATVFYGASASSRAHSPTPSGMSNTGYFNPRAGSTPDGQTSPNNNSSSNNNHPSSTKKGILGRFRRHKDKDKEDATARLRSTPTNDSSRSLVSKSSRADVARGGDQQAAATFPPNWPPPADQFGAPQDGRPPQPRAATFNNKFPFAKKGRVMRGVEEDMIGPTDRREGGRSGTVFHLDTNLNDMEGILTKPPPLTPMDHTFITNIVDPERVENPATGTASAHDLVKPPTSDAAATATATATAPVTIAAANATAANPSTAPNANGSWNAPDSWAVRRNTEDNTDQQPDVDDIGSPPRADEKMAPYCIRIFKTDNTFSTLSMPLDAAVADITLNKHGLQVGYEDKDRIEDVGREDNSYLCRFMFLSQKDSDFHSLSNDLGLGRMAKYNHVDLSARNLVTIPINLYSKAAEIISLNLSRNLSLDLPRDFIQSCQNLRDIKFNNNEARKLPPSLGKASKLTYLDVSNNRLEHLDHAELHNLTGILKFNLANNRLKYLPSYFGAYQSLRNLNISSNFLDTFPQFLCTLDSLVELDLSFNSISSLPDDIANMRSLENRLSMLRELDIKYNAITSIAVIADLPRLEILSADHNSISKFTGTFERIRSLKLNSNPIATFEIVAPALTLKMLNLSNCQLASIDESFHHMLNLERLVLDKNYFVSLPAHIGNLSKLEIFSIANNSVGELPATIGCLTELRMLDVRGNNMKKLPMELWWANKLETLNASSNVLDNFPKPASRQPRLGGEEQPQGALNGKGAAAPGMLAQASGVGPSPVPHGPDRKSSVVSGTVPPPPPSTFAGSLRNLYLADNQLDDEAFDQITMLNELRRSIKAWPQLVELYLSGNELTTLPADDLEDSSLLQVLHINGNKFTNLPADISRAKKLTVLDCGNNSLKYNIANVPYDTLTLDLGFDAMDNLSGNKRLEIKQTNLRVLGLMDVTLTQPTIPDQSDDRRVRTSGSLAGHLPYGMADTLGKNEHLSTVDLVNFGHIFAHELKQLKPRQQETPADALRRAFLSLNKDLVTVATQHNEDRAVTTGPGPKVAAQPVVLSKEDLNSGGVATVVYLQGTELFVANVGDAQAMLIQTDGSHKILTRKHDPAEPTERQRIREAGGWVSRNGKLNDLLEVSRAFGYVGLMPSVQAAPYVSNVTIRESDDIILLATRELWEYMSPGLIVDVVRSERGDLMRASQKLRDLAIAYGSASKIMIMLLSVSDLKRRMERSRLHRGQSMSLYPSGVPEDLQSLPRRGKKTKAGDVLDSTLQRLEAEIPAPTGQISIVFTDIKNSTTLWEMYPSAMRSAIKLHNEVMRRQLRRIGGYEVKTEGDAFMISLLEVNWPPEVLNSVSCQPLFDKDNALIFKGLSVRMGIHFGEAVNEMDPVTRRMDYFGPMVNKASRISAVADGGQITVSSDFISEVQRCLETSQDTDRNGSTGSDDAFDDDQSLAAAIRRDLRSLSSQGFEVKEMGERKLKGLENPEVHQQHDRGIEVEKPATYSLYPHALIGRAEQHQQHDRGIEVEKPATMQPGSELSFDPDLIWGLWRAPETELLERMKQRGGEVTERFLLNFMEHQVSRVETCTTTLALRHMANGRAPIGQLNELRAPITDVLAQVAEQMAELQRYKARFGELQSLSDEGSDTEQE
ncbi:Adenylate cyclase like protein [Verticillium longisporum]|uniref:Adenylate cyclase like protein n=1 Tax=Verticillium longisporum TaxID=100787 RepID=A0A8I2ZPS8_VERLO|nr:Adenylate cyclase like protein [Verticillium longisporum]